MLQIPKYPFTSILGWSVSRYETFSSCKRRYYYQYYAKHDPDYAADQIDALKNLTSIPLEVGKLTHSNIAEVLRRLLKSKSEIDRKWLSSFVKKQVEQTCQAKESFFEVHYSQKEEILPTDIMPPIEECLNVFLNSERFQWFKNKVMQNQNGWLIGPPGYGETRIDGLKAYCKVDFLFTVEGRRVILDWKTGKRDTAKHTKQLVAYSLWATNQLEERACNIDAVSAYLSPTYREVPLCPTERQLDEFTEQIHSETEEMYEFCRNLPENIPLNKSEFVTTQNGTICKFCNFKELCNRLQQNG
jgi:CRISPR/Cas system-associated exonuclease Cas4 (RecB family)